MNFQGGCLCGALRYESSDKPLESGYCHCSICRRSTSAPVVAFASFPIQAFVYTQGRPAIYRSSSTGQREFCQQCGTQIAHREIENPESVDVNSGTLDDMDSVPPTHHIYVESRVPWFDIEDELPRYPRGNT